MKRALGPKEARTAILKAIDSGNVEFANAFAEDALATMRMPESHPEYGRFIDVTVEPWSNKARKVQGFTVQWSRKGIGFGEATLALKDGKWIADTETMGKQFVIECLVWFVRNKVEAR